MTPTFNPSQELQKYNSGFEKLLELVKNKNWIIYHKSWAFYFISFFFPPYVTTWESVIITNWNFSFKKVLMLPEDYFFSFWIQPQRD